jgi:benzoylformate decarboxylase
MLKTQSPIAALDEVTPRRGAAVLLDVLRSEGVRYIFGNPGITELPLMDPLIDAPDISSEERARCF